MATGSYFPLSKERVKALELLTEILSCPMCRRLFRSPKSTDCQHNFCSECIDTALFKRSECPSCELPLWPVGVRKNPTYSNLTDRFVTLRRAYEAMEAQRGTGAEAGPSKASSAAACDFSPLGTSDAAVVSEETPPTQKQKIVEDGEEPEEVVGEVSIGGTQSTTEHESECTQGLTVAAGGPAAVVAPEDFDADAAVEEEGGTVLDLDAVVGADESMEPERCGEADNADARAETTSEGLATQVEEITLAPCQLPVEATQLEAEDPPIVAEACPRRDESANAGEVPPAHRAGIDPGIPNTQQIEQWATEQAAAMERHAELSRRAERQKRACVDVGDAAALDDQEFTAKKKHRKLHQTSPQRAVSASSTDAVVDQGGVAEGHAATTPVRRRRNSRVPVFVPSKLASNMMSKLSQLAQLVSARVVKRIDTETPPTHIVTTAKFEDTKGVWASARTLKYFWGLSHGSWVVHHEWVEECLRQRRLVPEEDYEIRAEQGSSDVFDTPRRARLWQAQNKPPLFRGWTFFLGPFDDNARISASNAELLLRLNGATIRRDYVPTLRNEFTLGSGERAAILLGHNDSHIESEDCAFCLAAQRRWRALLSDGRLDMLDAMFVLRCISEYRILEPNDDEVLVRSRTT